MRDSDRAGQASGTTLLTTWNVLPGGCARTAREAFDGNRPAGAGLSARRIATRTGIEARRCESGAVRRGNVGAFSEDECANRKPGSVFPVQQESQGARCPQIRGFGQFHEVGVAPLPFALSLPVEMTIRPPSRGLECFGRSDHLCFAAAIQGMGTRGARGHCSAIETHSARTDDQGRLGTRQQLFTTPCRWDELVVCASRKTGDDIETR